MADVGVLHLRMSETVTHPITNIKYGLGFIELLKVKNKLEVVKVTSLLNIKAGV
jgi:hypothetical protein